MENEEILNVPVIVCGVHNGEITESGAGFQEFKNIAEAHAVYPDLDISKNTERFTSAIKEQKNGVIVKLRFETWKANEIYSN